MLAQGDHGVEYWLLERNETKKKQSYLELFLESKELVSSCTVENYNLKV